MSVPESMGPKGPFAVSQVATADPTFAIETIVIEGEKQVPEVVILTESRLIAGQTYSEQQLRHAIQRINRLAYVMECRFRLKRGSKRGIYQLVITVEETRFWFVETTSTWSRSSEGGRTGNFDTGVVGARWFVGPADLLYVSSESFANWRAGEFDLGDQLTLGYSHFNLLDQNIFFDVQLGWQDGDRSMVVTQFGPAASENRDSWRLNLVAGVPVGENHWFKLVGRYALRSNRLWERDPLGEERLSAETDVRSGNLTFTWEYNTTDDSFVPRQGRLWRVGLLMGGSESNLESVAPGREIGLTDQDFYTADVRYEQHHPFWNRHNLSYQFTGEARRQDLRATTAAGDQPGPDTAFGRQRELQMNVFGDIVYAVDLWGNRKTRRYGDFRLELRQRLGYQHENNLFSSESGGVRLRESDHVSLTVIELKYRNAWAVARLRFEYVWRP
ncbi:POTRA domain-containing protein [Acanthopleuribacter pedis]|uniref:BamA/TamA family outer membrane protein n=1 Tax=Acanthopleuribacter pedis TaxID=442870 RepID=A0A8J7QF58_9BACT|nr:BamA/TamA family outer membrane protein [Acanthopleuribacter pedis]MBO1322909.1 BamA/TamA family outer membrane protein [Acanthopleuribacter pedis]